MVKLLTKEELRSDFSEIEPYFDLFLERFPWFSKHKMLEEVLTGKAVIWSDGQSFVIGKPKSYHTKDVFTLDSLAGKDLGPMLEGLKVIEADIKSMGYNEIECTGRAGWARVLPRYGYDPINVTLHKVIGE
jgi:hypothetical protein